MKPAPRPRARRLLAGRFLVPRASLLALPDGPVAGLDLATGDLVALAFGPRAEDAGAIAARITRWNELALPTIRELHWHLGRPLVSFEPPAGGRVDLSPRELADGARVLGEVLDAAGLGHPCGPADLELGPAGPYLRRPAIWPCDPAEPLARRLPELASRLLACVPVAVVEAAPAAPARVRGALGRMAPCARRPRIALAVACAVLSALVVSGLTASSHRAAVARASPPQLWATPLLPAHPAAVVPRRLAPRVRAAPPASRGGPAHELPFARVSSPAPAPRPVARIVPPTVRSPADVPTRGWVEGLFAGS